MASKLKLKDRVKVCTGPGCKAWGSEKILQRLREKSKSYKKKISVVTTSCHDNCGGGVTVKINLCEKPVKIRTTNQIWRLIINKPK